MLGGELQMYALAYYITENVRVPIISQPLCCHTSPCIVVLPPLYTMPLPIHIPTNMICLSTIGLLLGQRRWWINIKSTMGQCLVFAGIPHMRR